MSAALCRTSLGGKARTCGGAVTLTTDALGRVLEHCPRCAHHARGLCRLCPNPIRSAAHQFCTDCARARRRQQNKARAQEGRHKKRQREWAARRYREDAAFAAKKKAAAKAWREANPERFRAQLRRYQLQEGEGRERRLAYYRDYRARQQAA